jgi:hypothetical protein
MTRAQLDERAAMTRAPLGQQTVLLWTRWWTEQPGDWYLGQGTQPFATCPVNNCYLTGISTTLGTQIKVHPFATCPVNNFYLTGISTSVGT